MKLVLSFSLATLVFFLTPLDIADAMTKKEMKMRKCDAGFETCTKKCDKLIDIDNQVRDCGNDCTIKAAKCNLRANKAPVTAPGVGGGSVETPALSTD